MTGAMDRSSADRWLDRSSGAVELFSSTEVVQVDSELGATKVKDTPKLRLTYCSH